MSYELEGEAAKVVSHGRYVVFQMEEVAIPRQMFQEILRMIAELRPQPPPAPALVARLQSVTNKPTGGVLQMPAKIARLATRPLFWIPEVSVAVRSSRPSCSKAEK